MAVQVQPRVKFRNRPFAWAVDKYNIVGRLAQALQDRQGDRYLPSVRLIFTVLRQTPGNGNRGKMSPVTAGCRTTGKQ